MIGFIVNPVSGNGRGAAVWGSLEQLLRNQNISYRVAKTTKAGEAIELTENMLRTEDITVVVAIGGDGTINEVINGIHAAKASCLFGHIPAGSGNDFARGHGLSTNPDEALQKILSARSEEVIDLLQINGRIAVNAVGAGFDGQVAKTTNEAGYKKWLNRLRLGVLSYIISVIRVLCFYRPCNVQLTIDEKEEEITNVWLIVAANLPNYGGGMLICPMADVKDGIAEICVVSNVSRWGLLRAFPLIFSGSHVTHPAVRFYRGKKLKIESVQPLVVHADGEVAGQTPVMIEVLPCQQRIIK